MPVYRCVCGGCWAWPVCRVCGGLGLARVQVWCAWGLGLARVPCVLRAGADVLSLALCSGVRDALHLLPVQEPEAGALLSVSTGTRPPCAAASRHALTTDTPESQSAAVQAATLPPPLPGRLFHCLDPHCAITVPSGNPQAPEAASSAFSYTPKSQDLRSAPPICWAGG